VTRLALGLVVAAALLAGCGDGDDDDGDDAASMRGALGGSAATQTLARERLESLPPRPLAWVAHELVLDPGERPPAG
jgi:hypothetical protein